MNSVLGQFAEKLFHFVLDIVFGLVFQRIVRCRNIKRTQKLIFEKFSIERGRFHGVITGRALRIDVCSDRVVQRTAEVRQVVAGCLC